MNVFMSSSNILILVSQLNLEKFITITKYSTLKSFALSRSLSFHVSLKLINAILFDPHEIFTMGMEFLCSFISRILYKIYFPINEICQSIGRKICWHWRKTLQPNRERAHILTNCTHQPSLRHTSVQFKGCGEERKTHENFFRDSSTNMYRLFSFNILYETQCKKTLHHEIRFHTKCLSLFLSII